MALHVQGCSLQSNFSWPWFSAQLGTALLFSTLGQTPSSREPSNPTSLCCSETTTRRRGHRPVVPSGNWKRRRKEKAPQVKGMLDSYTWNQGLTQTGDRGQPTLWPQSPGFLTLLEPLGGCHTALVSVGREACDASSHPLGKSGPAACHHRSGCMCAMGAENPNARVLCSPEGPSRQGGAI